MPERKQRLPRDDLVEIVTDFYRFLVRMYIPESSLKFPPPESWPSITEESTKAMNKKPFVIDLIKHLPYIDDTWSRGMVTHINYKCDVVDYTNPRELEQGGGECLLGELGLFYDIEEAKNEGADNDEGGDDDGEGSDDEYDGDDEGHYWDWDETYNLADVDLSNCIPIACGYESGGRSFVLDVFNGTIHADTCGCQNDGQEEVQSFFEDLQQKLERLEDVPLPGLLKSDGRHDEGNFFNEVSEIGSFDESLTSDDKNYAQQVAGIYRSYGWPGESYDKAGALNAISDLQYRRWVVEEE